MLKNLIVKSMIGATIIIIAIFLWAKVLLSIGNSGSIYTQALGLLIVCTAASTVIILLFEKKQ